MLQKTNICILIRLLKYGTWGSFWNFKDVYWPLGIHVMCKKVIIISLKGGPHWKQSYMHAHV